MPCQLARHHEHFCVEIHPPRCEPVVQRLAYLPLFSGTPLRVHPYSYNQVTRPADSALFGKRTKRVSHAVDGLYAEPHGAGAKVRPAIRCWRIREPSLGSADVVSKEPGFHVFCAPCKENWNTLPFNCIRSSEGVIRIERRTR